MILKRTVFAMVLAMATLLIAGCSTSRSGSADPDARRASLNAGADAALNNLFRQVSGSEQMVNTAKGVLIFPAVLEADLVFGASSGDGVLWRPATPSAITGRPVAPGACRRGHNPRLCWCCS